MLRSSPGDSTGACVVVGAADGTVVMLVEDPGAAGRGVAEVVLVDVLGAGGGVVVGWAAAIAPPVASSATDKDATISDFNGESRCAHGKCRCFLFLAI